MIIRFLTLTAFFITTFINAQTPKVQWTKSIGGTGNERANSNVTDTKGNIVLVGRFQSPTIDLGKITLKKIQKIMLTLPTFLSSN